MAPPIPIDPLSADPLGLDLGLHDAARDEIGVIDLTLRVRPAGGRRSTRQTHTRLVAALARIQATTVAANERTPSGRAPAVCTGPPAT